MCYRKRQTNAAPGGINSDDLKTFTVPCNIDVQLDKAMVKKCSVLLIFYYNEEFILGLISRWIRQYNLML